MTAPNCCSGKGIKKKRGKCLRNSLSNLIEEFPQSDGIFYLTILNGFLHSFESYQNPNELLASVHSVAKSVSG